MAQRGSLLSWFLALQLLHALASTPAAQLGTVRAEHKISATEGGFGGDLDAADFFGSSVVSLGDLDGDGIDDLAVGARLDDDGGSNEGAVWILFLNADGTVASEQKISATEGGFRGSFGESLLTAADGFGTAVAALGDLDGDGIEDLAVGAPADDQGGEDNGAVWILFLHADGTVRAHQKITEATGGFGGSLGVFNRFGSSMAMLGDLDGDAIGELAVGAEGSGGSSGAVWILFLNADGTVRAEQRITEAMGGFAGTLDEYDAFGFSVAALGDLDGDGIADLAVGADGDDDGGPSRGAVWILFLNGDGTVASEQKVSATSGGFGGLLHDNDNFGASLAALADLDGDGVHELAAGAPYDGGPNRGALWILFLDADGTVLSEQKVGAATGGFGGLLSGGDSFGTSLGLLGDLDGDGVGELAVGALGDDDGGTNQGAVWILFLETDGVPPVLSCSPDQLVECTGPSGAVVFFDVTASDDRDPNPTLLCVPPSGSTFPVGTTNVSCTATDDAGNVDSCSFDVTVQDSAPPVVTCPADLVCEATSPGGALVTYAATATDACDPSPSLLYSPPSGSTFSFGTSTVLVTATDGGGNASMCSFDVTVADTTPPTLSCPTLLFVLDAKGGSPGDFVFFSVGASDLADPAPSVVCVPPSGSFFARGTTLVTCTATDGSGNQEACVFPVVVMPTLLPR